LGYIEINHVKRAWKKLKDVMPKKHEAEINHAKRAWKE